MSLYKLKEKIIFYAKQRRIWVALLSVLAFLATYFGYTSVAELIVIMSAQAGLALWSFAKPKK